MITLKCTSDNGKLFMIDSLGLKIRDGQKFDIEDSDINNPDIKTLLNLGIISAETEIETDDLKDNLREHMISFKCTLPLGKRMALDSVKGTVSGQCIISIPASASKNIDVKQAVNTGYLQKVGDVKEIEKAKEISKVSAKPKEIKEIIRDMYKDEDGLDKTTIALDTDSEKTNDNNAILELDEVVMSDIKTSTEDKKEPPMNRADDKKKSELQKIGSDIYSQEETVEAPKKIGRPKKTTSKVAVKKATAKKRGRPAKAKTEAEVKAPVKATAKKRGRPAKAKVEVESKASAPKKRGRPAKTTK